MHRAPGRSLTSADPQFRGDPHPAYDGMRAEPVPTVVPDFGCRFVTRHDQVLQGLEQLDYISDFAAPLPSQVILDMMGLSLSYSDKLKQWSEDILWGYDPDRDRACQQRLREAYICMTKVFREALGQRRPAPGNNLISALALPLRLRTQPVDS